MPGECRDIVVVGASAGGVEALRTIAAGFPADFGASVLVVLHMRAGGTSALPAILDRAGPLPAVGAVDGMPLEPGVVYVAQPDHHLLVDGDVLRLSKGPTESGHRPAIDALFRSAAISAGPRAVGVVLSGVRDDGARGLRAIADRGGATVVQDPDDALYSGMPSSALSMVDADYVVPVVALADALTKVTGEIMEFPDVPPPADHVVLEDRIARDGMGASLAGTGPGTQTRVFSCPDCNGVLVEIAPATGAYRCLIGHAWTQEALLAAQGADLQHALMTALRGLEERAVLADRMERGAKERGQRMLGERCTATKVESSAAAEVLRGFLQSVEKESAMSPAELES